MTRRFKFLSTSGALLLLTACGGAPSDADIKSALEKATAMSAKAVAQFDVMGIAKSMQPEFKNIKKIGCKEDGEKAYKCDVEYEVTQLGNTSKQTMPMRFVKGSDGWALTP